MCIELKTERLKLCPLGTEYLNSVHSYASDIDNTKYIISLPNHYLEETEQFLMRVGEEWQKLKPEFYEFAIILGDLHIGHISIYLNEDGNEAEFGWILNRLFHGKGYAFEAACSLLDFAVKNLGIKHFIAHCDTRNTASRRVMEKLGMKRVSEGPREYQDERGSAREYMYSLDIL